MWRSTSRAAAAILAAALLLVAGCSESLPRKQVLSRLPAKWSPAGFAVSNDLEHYAFQERLADGVRMIQDGKPGPVYSFLNTRSFAPESDRLFYWAIQRAAERRDETFLIAAGTPYQVGMSRHEFLTFPFDGSRWAVVAAVPSTGDVAPPADGRVMVLVDGSERGRWSDASIPAFSQDAAHVAWIVAEPAPTGEAHRRIVVDGASRAELAGAPGRCVSPIEADAEGGPALPRYERVLYLSDGRLVAIVRDRDGWALWREGDVIRRYPVAFPTSGTVTEVIDDFCPRQAAIAAGSLVAAKNAPTMVWWERVDGRWRLVRDGQPVDGLTCERYWDLPPPVVSDDGRAWAYPCVTTSVTGEEIFVVTPSGRHGPYGSVWAITLSDDGSRVAYGATVVGDDASAPWRVYADGVAYPPRYYSVWRPRFDPCGRHLLWEGMPTARGHTALAIDGHDLAHVDQLIDGPVFLDPGWASWAVRQRRRLVRINLPLRGSRCPVPSRSSHG